MPPLNFIYSGRSVHKHLPIERNFVDYTHYCESSISLEGGHSKDGRLFFQRAISSSVLFHPACYFRKYSHATAI